MRRTYNANISERANRRLAKREAEVRAQKFCLMVCVVLAIILGVLLGTTVSVFATKDNQPPVQKYYKSICVEAGDTLWDIAGEYNKDSGMSRLEYVEEVCALNGIRADEIRAGEYIVIVYFE